MLILGNVCFLCKKERLLDLRPAGVNKNSSHTKNSEWNEFATGKLAFKEFGSLTEKFYACFINPRRLNYYEITCFKIVKNV